MNQGRLEPICDEFAKIYVPGSRTTMGCLPPLVHAKGEAGAYPSLPWPTNGFGGNSNHPSQEMDRSPRNP
ncbi:hypothetical protein ACOSQ2_022242 [Xanthoceras sorbifolium]